MKRILSVLAILVAVGVASPPSFSPVRAQGSVDIQLLGQASAKLSHAASITVVRWLQHQPGVSSVRPGMDGKTLDIRFVDGLRGAILPKTKHTVSIDNGQLVSGRRQVRMSSVTKPSVHSRLQLPPSAQVHPAQPVRAPGARAAVLEPFATELGLGANAGAPEVAALQQSGFAVDVANDTNVTVGTMLTLPTYGVVYMHTHSGVDSTGHGVVATGQPADGDPGVAPFINDGTVQVVGVAGSTTTYYAITSKFVTIHMSTFHHDAMLFINGCSLLSTPDFGAALLGHGAGVLVSWDKLATSQDDYLAAAAFFNVMNTGETVAHAIATERAAGYGASQYNGQTATLGFQGDGTVTLQRAGNTGAVVPPSSSTATPSATHPPVIPPPPPPGPAPSTPVPTVTSIPATAIPSATAIPTTIPPLTITLSSPSPAAANRNQVITAQSVPGATIRLSVTFPDGNARHLTQVVGANGIAAFTFLQHASRISRESRTAHVDARATQGTRHAAATGSYEIAFSAVDVVVEPRTVAPGGSVVIWVHSQANTPVSVSIHGRGRTIHLSSVTRGDGWASLVHHIAQRAASGTTYTVGASVPGSGRHRHTSTSYRIQ